VSHATVDEVKSRAAAAETRVQRAEAALSRHQASGDSLALAAHRACCSGAKHDQVTEALRLAGRAAQRDAVQCKAVQRRDLRLRHAQADDQTGSVTAELKGLQDEIAALRKVWSV